MRGRFEKALRRAGGEAVLLRDGEEVGLFAASLQPAARPGKGESTPSGFALPGQYTLYAAGEVAGKMEAGDSVVWDNEKYYIHSVQPLYVGGRAVYWRALAQREEGEGWTE